MRERGARPFEEEEEDEKSRICILRLADSCIECLRDCWALLSKPTVRLVVLGYSELHKKAYNFLVCEFGGFEGVLRGRSRPGHPYIVSTNAMIHVISWSWRTVE